MLGVFKKKEDLNQKKEVSLEENIYTNIFNYIISDKNIQEMIKEFMSRPTDHMSAYDLNIKNNLSDKYYSKKLDLFATGEILEKSYMKKESDKRAKAYFRLSEQGKKFVKGINFRKKSFEMPIMADLPVTFRPREIFVDEVNLGYIMRFFPKSDIRASSKDLERLILNQKIPVRTLELSYHLDFLELSGLLEKIYSKEKGDKRPKLYYQRTDLGKTFVKRYIK